MHQGKRLELSQYIPILSSLPDVVDDVSPEQPVDHGPTRKTLLDWQLHSRTLRVPDLVAGPEK
jgi:hypothetical protein